MLQLPLQFTYKSVTCKAGVVDNTDRRKGILLSKWKKHWTWKFSTQSPGLLSENLKIKHLTDTTTLPFASSSHAFDQCPSLESLLDDANGPIPSKGTQPSDTQQTCTNNIWANYKKSRRWIQQANRLAKPFTFWAKRGFLSAISCLRICTNEGGCRSTRVCRHQSMHHEESRTVFIHLPISKPYTNFPRPAISYLIRHSGWVLGFAKRRICGVKTGNCRAWHSRWPLQ